MAERTQFKMGASVSWLSGMLWSKKEIRILILGLVWKILVPKIVSLDVY